jgi:ESCRT-II complex subunit VPS25
MKSGSNELIQFEFPKIHSFPPLYTKQPNVTVLNNQLESWMNIILSYCQYYQITSLLLNGQIKYCQDESVDVSKLPELFNNKSINRSINDDFKLEILQYMIKKNKAGFINPKQKNLGIFIYYKSLNEWSDLLYSYIDSTGQLNTILTIYELTKSEMNLPKDLYNLDELLLVKIIKDVLMKSGKAQIIMDDNGEIGGVKIV